jgi:hypothetical protein
MTLWETVRPVKQKWRFGGQLILLNGYDV